jgi:hypothetical protein
VSSDDVADASRLGPLSDDTNHFGLASTGIIGNRDF